MWNLLAYLWLLHFTISNFHMPQPVCVVNWHFNFVFRHISNSLVVDYGTEHRQWLGTTRSGANSAFDSVKCTWWQSHVNGRDSPVKLMNLNAINFHGLLSVSRNSSTICQHWNGIGNNFELEKLWQQLGTQTSTATKKLVDQKPISNRIYD